MHFRAGTSLVTVCPHCRAAVSRKGVNLENIGVVAELVPTSSPFQLGMAGRPKQGYKRFTIVGRLQLSTGEGVWDEWHVAFDDGRYGWLAEAQGAFYLMKPMPAPKVAEWVQLSPDDHLHLDPYGGFRVSEKRESLYVAAEGDLPFVAPPGSHFQYCDLTGDDGSFATLDYGDDPGLDGFFVGRRIELTDLGIPGLTTWDKRSVAAKASSLNCPSCGGAIQLKDPNATVRIACPYCGSILGEKESGAGKFEVLKRLQKVPLQPEIPLGSEGTLNGHPYVVLGLVGKSTTVEEIKYYWGEYLLKETKTEDYHWLVVSNGHWSLVEPVRDPVSGDDRLAVYQGRSYRLFQVADAKVEAVLGEFYWEIKQGEKTTALDFVNPPRILSKEISGNEVNWSEGVYVPKQDVDTAFALKEPLPDPTGIAPNQPWPRETEARIVRRTAGILALVAIGLFILFQILWPKKVVFEGKFQLRPLLPDDKPPETLVLTEPFEIPRSGNIEVHLEAPTDNNWVAVGMNLIDQSSGEVRSFGLVSDYYHGVDDGSEGSRDRTLYLSSVPKGKYVLRLEPEFEAGKQPDWYAARLRSGVPRFYRLVWVLLFIGAWPFFLMISRIRFESARWADSDVSGGGGSSDSGDDDE